MYKAVLVRHRANAVWVDPATNEVLLTTDGRDMNLHQRIGEMADPLHFGYFGGYWTKIPWFLFGLLITGLSVSKAPDRQQPRPASSPSCAARRQASHPETSWPRPRHVPA